MRKERYKDHSYYYKHLFCIVFIYSIFMWYHIHLPPTQEKFWPQSEDCFQTLKGEHTVKKNKNLRFEYFVSFHNVFNYSYEASIGDKMYQINSNARKMKQFSAHIPSVHEPWGHHREPSGQHRESGMESFDNINRWQGGGKYIWGVNFLVY